ncbi:TIGR04325 family methyltransferase [Solimonas variicoloris]|uniref:TIGR04325 family methyltransferase n=1 Tax=Solimonas variicoloris TaxID=254408 RepID=UPI0003665E75|nr:TIGR04325 family methyltransferase [Solimonas variicoloris]
MKLADDHSQAAPAAPPPQRMPRLFSRAVDASAGIGWMRALTERVYAQRFNRCTAPVRLFRGLYPSFAAARRDIPPQRLEGYDHAEAAGRVAHDRFRVFASDYPVLLWLSRLLPDTRLLLDWGGNIGISYYAYRRFLQYPPGCVWMVSDVPAVVELGRRIAKREGDAALQFTTGLERLADADVLLAAGSLHYIETPYAALEAAWRRPPHLLINKLPACAAPDAVTLQNIGPSICPMHLFNRDAFVERIERLGYRRVDAWENADLGCRIPGYPRYRIDAYSGFYFRSAAAS